MRFRVIMMQVDFNYRWSKWIAVWDPNCVLQMKRPYRLFRCVIATGGRTRSVAGTKVRQRKRNIVRIKGERLADTLPELIDSSCCRGIGV